MATLDAESVDSIVTDPPYGLSFMGRDWDHGVPGEAFWREALRVAKPGAHLLAFGGSRTYHRLACAIEDAGWEIRDCIMWVYGSGFPKSHDVSKAIDREAGAEREVVGQKAAGWRASNSVNDDGWQGEYANERKVNITASATDVAKQWDGWGTALKPAYEPIIVARKPLIGTVAANVQQYGTGAINVDGCRVGAAADINARDFDDSRRSAPKFSGKFNNGQIGQYRNGSGIVPDGRWPANFIHDGGDEVVQGLGESARFFYCAKAGKRDRDEGCESFQPRVAGGMEGRSDGSMGSITYSRNIHPTVKPTDLMRYLCRLVTPPGGTVLDPFMGSGSTGKGATLEGFNFIGIEQNAEYIEIAKARIQHAIDSASEKLFSDSV
jgi:hypothetical protein